MRLAIQLLGTPQFQLDLVNVTAKRRAVVALLAYLAVTHFEHPGQRFSRESLAALLWTDYDPAKALGNLRHTLWEVTQFIGDGWIRAEHETVYLNPKADLTLDVDQFQSLRHQAVQKTNPAERIPLLVEASKLYRDDFLQGFTLKDGSNFNEWAFVKTDNLRQVFASALDTLVKDYQDLQQIGSAVPYAQRLISLNPLHEPAQRTLMQLFALADQHTAAIQQYLGLEKLLRKELNLDPQPETRELYKKIRRGEFKTSPVVKNTQQLERTTPKHNLPVHLTAFIGREKEREEISHLISQRRLVTLVGPGGIGKTRLALQTAYHLMDDYPDGVWFIPLESVTEKEVVPQIVASFFNIIEQPGQPILDRLVDELRIKSILLILDNCEHLLDVSAQIAERLLKNCPNLKILTTSRDLLRVEGEASYTVRPLALPENQNLQSVDEVAGYESVQLFTERAVLARSDFKLTLENIRTISEICRRLDGLPLAIELAAAHVDIFSPEEILRQLHHSFDLLASNTRSGLPRHQTMRTCIDWGWNLLTEAERFFLSRISVFIGGWTLHAAQTVVVNNPVGLITALLKKSFIVVHQQESHDTRYGFHEVIRLFAQEKLAEAGEEQTLRDRHLSYYLELARQAEPAIQGIDQTVWLERLFEERDNIRAALVWAARTNVQAGLYISHRLRALWESSQYREEVSWLLTI